MISLSLIKMLLFYVRNANRQSNLLYRFRYIFNIEERKLIHNTFILVNFNYCPIVWHFCDKA